MMTQNAALDRLTQQVEAGTDAVISGAPTEQSALLAQAAAALASTCTVVSVTAPPTGLNLSGLMAQLSGRADLDAQDDAVLELGFRRLAITQDGRRTALLLDLAAGVQRPVLRYLQHVGRGVPSLAYVVAPGPGWAAMLSEPVFAPLRARLMAQPAIEAASSTAAVLPDDLPQPVLASPVALMPLAPAPLGRRGPLVWPWALAGAGMAASLALGAYIGHASREVPMTVAQETVRPTLSMPIEAAQPALPRLAKAAAIEVAPVDRGIGMPAHVPPPDAASFAAAPPVAVPPQAELHAAAGATGFEFYEPKATAETDPAQHPATIVTHLAPPRTPPVPRPHVTTPPRSRVATADPLPPLVPSTRRWARLQAQDRDPDAVGRDDWIRAEPQPYPDQPARWRGARYAPAPLPDGPYIGTYTTGPYGNRVFHYDQP